MNAVYCAWYAGAARRRLPALCWCLVLAWILFSAFPAMAAPAGLDGLSRSVLYCDDSGLDAFSPARGRGLEQDFQRYRKGAGAFASICSKPPANPDLRDSFASEAMFRRRNCLERSLALLSGGAAESGPEACRYAREATLFLEWEGGTQAPGDEAAYASGYLKAHPHTGIKPFLLLFIAHRLIAVSQASLTEGNPEGAKQAAAHAKRYLAKARAERNALVRVLAEHLQQAGRKAMNPGG